MKIKDKKPGDLKPADYNPRKLTPKQEQDLTASIEKFGLVDPILINTHKGRENVVIGGHQRLKIAIKLGLQTVPCFELDLDLAAEKELNVRLNKNTGEWDMAKMVDEFDYNELLTWGWESKELDQHYDNNAEDEFNAQEEFDKIETPIAKPGDIWTVGPHAILCGDSTKDIMTTKAHMVFTDPPYNVNYSGEGKKTSVTIANDNQDGEKFQQFLTDAFKIMAKSVIKSAPWYICYASRTHREFENAVEAAGYKVRNQIIWVKKVASMGWGDYRWKHEPILYCTNGTTQYFGDRKQYTEWSEELTDAELLKRVKKLIEKDESGTSTVWRLGREHNYDHPTQKPIQLINHAIRNSSKAGQTVLDPFGGGGSTMVACHRLHRKAILCELEPKWVDVTIMRMRKEDNTLKILCNGKEVRV